MLILAITSILFILYLVYDYKYNNITLEKRSDLK